MKVVLKPDAACDHVVQELRLLLGGESMMSVSDPYRSETSGNLCLTIYCAKSPEEEPVLTRHVMSISGVQRVEKRTLGAGVG